MTSAATAKAVASSPGAFASRPGLSMFLTGIAVGVLLTLFFFDSGKVQGAGGAAGGVVCPKRAPPGQRQDPASMGELNHEQSGKPWPSEFRTWLVDKPEELSDLFRERAMIQGTDKTTTHRYQYMYAKYLLPVRHREIKLLEIGLGCDTEWGPGHSVDLWHELLPRMTYYSIELDGGCAMKFVPRLGNRQFIGSQDDPSFLAKVVNVSGPVDVVIDDGSHFSSHQRSSFLYLWPFVKPGGLYVIEDLQCNFLSGYHGEGTGMATGGGSRMVVEFVLALMGRGAQGDSDQLAFNEAYINSVASVDCFREACVFIKAGYPEPVRGKARFGFGEEGKKE
jgi:hypothetical protein